MVSVNRLSRKGPPKGEKAAMPLPVTAPIEAFAPPSTEPLPLSFAESILTAEELDKLEIPARESLVGSWWKEGASGFIFGERGKGKTWMSMHLARCLAEGRACGEWMVPRARCVLYVDGEMALDALRERDRALSQSGVSKLHFLSHYQHFEKKGLGLNLTEPDAQKALLGECEKLKIEVLFLDNLSCLFSGVRENEADSWELISGWLLNFRRRGIAVCIVHHAGRNAAHMRGTTRREDAAFWVMSLASPMSEEDCLSGWKARFVSRFTKDREGSSEDRGPFEWVFETPAEGAQTTVRWKSIDNLGSFVQCVEDGLDTCGMLAEELHLSKGAVSKLAKKAASQQLINIVGEGNQRRYVPVAKSPYS